MKTIKLSNASRPLAEYARELNEDIVVLTDRNKPVAAIVRLKGVDKQSLALSAHPEFLEIIAQSRAEFAAGQTRSLDQMKRDLLARRKANNGPGQGVKKRSRSKA